MAKSAEMDISDKAQASPSSSHSHVKRPMNAFMVWAKTERRRLAMRLPGMPNSEVSKILGDLWKQLPEQEKSRYRSESESIRKQHRDEHPDYRYHPRRRTLKAPDGKQAKTSSVGSCRTARSKGQKSKGQQLCSSAVPSFCSHQLELGATEQRSLRQVPECYFDWMGAQTQVAPRTTFTAPAPFGQSAVGQSQEVTSAPSLPPNMTFDNEICQPHRAEVAAAVLPAAGHQCGWPMKLGDGAGEALSERIGALAAPVWQANESSAINLTRGECLSDVGTPPALMHLTIGGSPHSTACSSLYSPVTEQPLSRVTSPTGAPYEASQQDPSGGGGVVPSNDGYLGNYMQLYLGDSQKNPDEDSSCKLNLHLAGNERPPMRSTSPPFSVPSTRAATSRDKSVASASMTSAAYGHSMPMPSTNATCEPHYSAPALAAYPVTSYAHGASLTWEPPVVPGAGQTLPITAHGHPRPSYHPYAAGFQKPCTYSAPIFGAHFTSF